MRQSAVAPRHGKARLAKARPVTGAVGLTAPSCTATCTTKKPPRKRREATALSIRSDNAAAINQVPANEDPSVDPGDKENACGNADEDYVAVECRRLREQLERVLVDRERQEDEIVALRALAKSLKEEVEATQRQRLSQSSGSQVRFGAEPLTSSAGLGSSRPHEFFKLDIKLEELRAENAALREQLDTTTHKYNRIREFVDRELRVNQLTAVKATAELQSATSQLVEEQAECDRLRAQVARYKVRGDEPVRVAGLAGAADRSKRQLLRAREELLLQCLAEEGDHRRWRRADDSKPTSTVSTGVNGIDKQCGGEAGSRRSAGSEGSTDAPTRDQNKLEELGDDVAALETQLRGLHASLELTRSMADDTSGDVNDAPQLSAHGTSDCR